jgi:lipopolysaccharide/colanic/teichoic acid biosynthesis glycosyltransferase
MNRGIIQIQSNIQKVQKENNINHYSNTVYIQKRIIDILLGTIILIISSPIVIYSIYRIKKESSGSIIFKQSRVGLNGKIFTCYKFRTMYEKSTFNPYTQKEDSRIFPFGQIMRKYRIDEIPQIWNVIKGDMHIIGPRAEWNILVKEYEKTIPHYHQRHQVKPGITGLAQVSYPYGCNLYDTKKKLEFDLEYIKEWSLWLEMKVIFRTVGVVLHREGI